MAPVQQYPRRLTVALCHMCNYMDFASEGEYLDHLQTSAHKRFAEKYHLAKALADNIIRKYKDARCKNEEQKLSLVHGRRSPYKDVEISATRSRKDLKTVRHQDSSTANRTSDNDQAEIIYKPIKKTARHQNPTTMKNPTEKDRIYVVNVTHKLNVTNEKTPYCSTMNRHSNNINIRRQGSTGDRINSDRKRVNVTQGSRESRLRCLDTNWRKTTSEDERFRDLDANWRKTPAQDEQVGLSHKAIKVHTNTNGIDAVKGNFICPEWTCTNSGWALESDCDWY